MENINRNDALKFFESMTEKEQQVAINKLQSQIKKPPEPTDINVGQSESEVAEHEESTT